MTDSAWLIELYQKMLKLRLTEEKLAFLYGQQEMRTPTHFGTGQEAIAVGVAAVLKKGDMVFSHHRCHNHFLALGGSVFELASELYGRSTGCSGGRGGSVHLTDTKNGLIATSAILGETTAIAAGAALSFKMDGLDNISACFFGEGVMDEGVIYETLNFSSIHNLPVLFVCENNLYSMESPLSVRQVAGSEFFERAKAFGIESLKIDGNDVSTVYDTTFKAVSNIRNKRGPYFIECMTYRWREHVGHMYDYEMNRNYRSREELDSWMLRCPIAKVERFLLNGGMIDQDIIDTLRERLETEIESEIRRAQAAPWPDPTSLFDHI